MRKNLYDAILKQISRNLQDKEGTLTRKEIEQSIDGWKKILPHSSLEVLKVMLQIDNIKDIDMLIEDDWIFMQRELEEKFAVRIERGLIIQGTDQRNRLKDLSWWTGKKRLKSDMYYLNNFMEYIKDDLPPNVLDTMDFDTDIILNNLADPEGEDYSIRGMVVGHVQSGKTANYSSLICKAADAGYKFIVVIAGGQNNLRNQTQKRLNQVFVGSDKKGVGNLSNFTPEKQPISLTSEDHDFKKQMISAHTTTNLHNTKNPVLIVIKKHTTTLDHLLEWIGENKLDKPVLVIDDESDYASINTKKEEDPTIINRKIRDLLNRFSKSAYVAYTATPFANIFIDHEASHLQYGEDLFPRDFIYALKAPDNYFGAEKIFGSEKDEHISIISELEVAMLSEEVEKDGDGQEYITYNDDKFIIKHSKDYVIEFLPTSLYEAINHFLLNIAIRKLRKQDNKHNSMLIHISRFTDVHIQVKKIIKDYYEDLVRDIKAYGLLETLFEKSHYINSLRDVFNKHLAHVEFNFTLILKTLVHILNEKDVQIVDVHQKNKGLRFEYRDDEPINAIVIGGLSLSRGFTLEGLSISYFLRTTAYYDTLMQMGRWFGYRIGYQDVCKLYTTSEIVSKFKGILDATNDLMTRLEMMRDENLTPEDFGLAVKVHPDSLLQVTARNKLKNAKEMPLSMDLNGTLKETVVLDAKPEVIEYNETITSELMDLLYEKYGLGELNGKHYVWRKVDSEIIKIYINKYNFLRGDLLGLKSRCPILFIKKYLEQNILTWDIVLLAGSSTEKFKTKYLEIKRPYRTVEKITSSNTYRFSKSQVATGKVERYVVKEEYQKYKASEMRKYMERPTLFIHALELRDKNEKQLANAIALSFSFNMDGAQSNPINVMINTVLSKEIEQAGSNYMDDENYEE